LTDATPATRSYSSLADHASIPSTSAKSSPATNRSYPYDPSKLSPEDRPLSHATTATSPESQRSYTYLARRLSNTSISSSTASRVIFDASNDAIPASVSQHFHSDSVTSAFIRSSEIPALHPILNQGVSRTMLTSGIMLPPVRPPSRLHPLNPIVEPTVAPNICFQCHKKLTAAAMTAFVCRCGMHFCPTHRFPDRHACVKK
jgi:hypothetical protein